MSCATLWAPRNRSLVSDGTDMGSTELRLSERRCKGIRRPWFEMRGIAPPSIESEKTAQRRRVYFILRKDDGLNLLGEVTRCGLNIRRVGMRLTDTAASAAGRIERDCLSTAATLSPSNLRGLERTPNHYQRDG